MEAPRHPQVPVVPTHDFGLLAGYRISTAAAVLARTAVVPGVVLYAAAHSEAQMRIDLTVARSHARGRGWPIRSEHVLLQPAPLDSRSGWGAAQADLAGGWALGLVAASVTSLAGAAVATEEYAKQLSWCHTRCCFVDPAWPEAVWAK